MITGPSYNDAWDELYIRLARKRIEEGNFDAMRNEGGTGSPREVSHLEREQILAAVDPWVLTEFLSGIATSELKKEIAAYKSWITLTRKAFGLKTRSGMPKIKAENALLQMMEEIFSKGYPPEFYYDLSEFDSMKPARGSRLSEVARECIQLTHGQSKEATESRLVRQYPKRQKALFSRILMTFAVEEIAQERFDELKIYWSRFAARGLASRLG